MVPRRRGVRHERLPPNPAPFAASLKHQPRRAYNVSGRERAARCEALAAIRDYTIGGIAR